MQVVTLTDTERLILSNQYEIMSMIGKDKHYALMAETLRAGHKWLYDGFFDHVSENLSDDQTKHVITILGIYSELRDSYGVLTDKTDIDEVMLHFPGFDGNNECDLLSFADSLIKHGRFTTTLGGSAENSHTETTDIYSRMIKCWQELGRPKYPYSKDNIQKILAARHYPGATP